MAGNKTAVTAHIASQITATVSIAKHVAALTTEADSIVESAVFKKDVVLAHNNGSTATYTTDFSSYEQINITQSGDIDITIAGLVDGQIGKLTVLKLANDIVSFNASVPITVTSGLSYDMTRMEYLVISINSQITVFQVNDELREFNLGGSPASGLAITEQNNFIEGRKAHLNMEIAITGGASETNLFLGSLPFYNEFRTLAKQDQFISNVFKATGVNQASYTALEGSSGTLYLNKDFNSSVYVGGIITL